jgi:hypothetical protein
MIPAGATIRRARVPPALAGPAGRALLQRWLADVEPQRYGLPAAAIVVVRRVQGSVASLSRPQGADALAHAMRGAVRPAREDCIGADVGVVWFADEAELLACLARDALGGRLVQRWWWPLVLAAPPGLPAALRRWCTGARVVPQALAQLAEQGDDVAWLRLLQASGRAELLLALVQHHPVGAAAMRCLQQTEARMLTYKEHAPLPTAASASAPPDETSAAANIEPSAEPAQMLLRLAALLRTAPQRALDEQVAAWLREPPSKHPPSHAVGVAVAQARAQAPPRPVPLWQAASVTAAAGESATIRVAAVRAAASGGDAEAATPGPARPPRASPAPRPAGASPFDGAHLPLPATRRHPAPVLQGLTTLSSEFGGLCFLLNVALAASLYGDFTQPRHAGLPLSPWRFLHAAGGSFFGRRFKADPLAALLAARAGPQPLPPTPVHWQISAAGLRPFAADPRPWHALRSPQRLRIVHPAGFIVAQVVPGADVQTLLAGAPGVVWHERAAVSAAGQGLLGLLWPWLRQRLALALGLPAVPAARALALPARVQARGEQLHLHFSLRALPLAVRLAGLDRDPGWVPAAGCDFRFHFD